MPKFLAKVRLALKIRRAIKQGDIEMLSNLFSLGALKSKTVWFGIAQLVWAAAQVYMSSGTLTPEAITTLVTGVGTLLFRAVTSAPLASK